MAIKYKVKWGDTLWDLSRKYGVTIDSIVKANKQIKDPHWIYTGDTLIIPTVDQILNQAEFSYDLGSDPLYRQYRDQYMQAGAVAMRDTMGQAAALTGGYGSSYASTAGSQAYSQYLSQLNQVAPDLYNAAYNRYQAEQDRYLSQMDMLLQMDDEAYEKYRDQVSDYQDQLDYYKDRYEQQQAQEYKEYLEKLEAWQKDREYGYKKSQDQREQEQWEEEMRLQWNKLWN